MCLHLLDDTLLGIRLFQILQLEELALLIGVLKPFAISKNTFLVQAGDETSELYILRSGRMAVCNSRGEVVRMIAPGAYFGELAAFGVDSLAKFSVKAVSFSE